MYEIEYEREVGILFYKVSGFWSMEMLVEFQKELMEWVRKSQAHCKDFRVLSDSTEFAVQSTDVAAEISHMMDVAVKITKGRKAFVVGSSLQKMQYKRIISHPTVDFFLNTNDAREWLSAGE